jgi:membrane protein implicated in regulation of membrane protease activity
MAGAPSDYHRGEMDIHEQVNTYKAFLTLAKWGSLAIISGVLFFVLLFCTKAGFIGAAATVVILVALSVLFLREKKTPAH